MLFRGDWLYCHGNGLIKSNLLPYQFEENTFKSMVEVEDKLFKQMVKNVGADHILPQEEQIKALIRKSIAFRLGTQALGKFQDGHQNLISENVYKTCKDLGQDYLCIMWEIQEAEN